MSELQMRYSYKNIMYGVAGIVALGAIPALAHHEMNARERYAAEMASKNGGGGTFHCEEIQGPDGKIYMGCTRENVKQVDTPMD